MKATLCCALAAVMENWIHTARAADHLWWWKDRDWAIGVRVSTVVTRDDGSPLVEWLVKRLADGNEVSGSAPDVTTGARLALSMLDRSRAHTKKHAGDADRIRAALAAPHLAEQFPDLLQPYVSPF